MQATPKKLYRNVTIASITILVLLGIAVVIVEYSFANRVALSQLIALIIFGVCVTLMFPFGLYFLFKKMKIFEEEKAEDPSKQVYRRERIR